MHKIAIEKEPDYVKLYLKDILYLSDLPRNNYRILLYLLNHATYANDGQMQILLPVGLKKMMMEELNIPSLQVVNNVIANLNKEGIIYRVATSVYRLNPYLFGRGEWKDIKKIRLTVEYNLTGRTAKAVIQKGGKESATNEILDKCVDELEKSWKNAEPPTDGANSSPNITDNASARPAVSASESPTD